MEFSIYVDVIYNYNINGEGKWTYTIMFQHLTWNDKMSIVNKHICCNTREIPKKSSMEIRLKIITDELKWIKSFNNPKEGKKGKGRNKTLRVQTENK